MLICHSCTTQIEFTLLSLPVAFLCLLICSPWWLSVSLSSNSLTLLDVVDTTCVLIWHLSKNTYSHGKYRISENVTGCPPWDLRHRDVNSHVNLLQHYLLTYTYEWSAVSVNWHYKVCCGLNVTTQRIICMCSWAYWQQMCSG